MTATLSGHRVLPGGVTIRWRAGAATSPLPQLLADLAALLDRIGPHRLDRPTPCPAFDVHALQRHVLAGLAGFAAALTGRDHALDVRDRGALDVRAAAERVAAALDGGVATRPVRLPGDDVRPGAVVLDRLATEVIVHGWDLARATGEPWDPSPQACASAGRTLRPLLRTGERAPLPGFSPEVTVTDGASTLDQLLALTGRDPCWTAPA